MGLACGAGTLFAQTPRAAPPEAVTLQLKWKHQFQSAGFYAAIEQGYYRDAGLDVTLREAQQDEEPADVVLRGGAEFGVATSDLVLLRNQGRPVVVLAPIFQHSPYVFLVAEGSGISSIHDLKGKSLMIEAHADELLAYLEFEGISRKDVHLVPHTFDPSSLVEGKVAAMSAYSGDEPYLLEKDHVKYLTFTPRAAGIDFYGDTLFTTEGELRSHPDRVKRFLDASLKGWRYALDHPVDIVDLILAKYSQRHTRDHLLFEAEMSRRLILPDVVEVGYMNPGRWRHIADVYGRLGMMPPNASLDGLLYLPGGPDLTRFYAALAIALLVIAALSFVVLRFVRMNRAIREQAESLTRALGEIKLLQGIIPICAHCKNVRDDQGYWSQVERYIGERTGAQFSHAVCASCAAKHYPEFYPPVE
ncbi:MAG TPA: ABC transporter substrate-binding protein [Vicinamibacterales bacterium]|jgi:ABC-type nitrate/sulfonate/bicarbonate transport system substrate-binding protein|nr:ABC transporter substrate-binding protein [Vicinamibacterales bacterium]